ncbi:MAG: endonuclease III domain-containing protein [Thermoplasmata archaeon]
MYSLDYSKGTDIISTDSLLSLFRSLSRNYGFVYWWPADSPVEVIEGAVLTQNTAWKNVEKAMARLRGKTVRQLLSDPELSEKIRPAGFHFQKERYLKNVLLYFDEKIEGLSLPIDIREELLKLPGVGRETADSIALYAFHQRTVPVDAYTLRLFNRFFGLSISNKNYEMVRAVLSKIFNQEQLMEFHALIDEHCKLVCKKIPKCDSCSIRERCKKNF